MAKNIAENVEFRKVNKKNIISKPKLSDSNAQEIRKKKDIRLNRMAWRLLITGIFTLGVALSITIFVWCYIPGDNEEETQTIANNQNDDKGDIDISINIEGAKSRAIKLYENMNIGQSQKENYCYEKSCNVHCNKTENLYNNIYQAIRVSKCHTIENLFITNQIFDDHMKLSATEQPSNALNTKLNVGEIILLSPNITMRNKGLFDLTIFNLNSTYSLSMIKGDLLHARAELLENFSSLRYLTMLIKIRQLSCNFFTPVQNQLKNLIMNAGLKLLGNERFFGTATMHAMVSLDLSLNFIKGRLSKIFFEGLNTNLKYLRLQECDIKSIESKAFEDFNNLIFVDLSHNVLRTISPETLKPLLLTSNKLLIDLRFNNWNCDCDLVPFLITYFAFTDKFFDGNYCSEPEHMHGLPWHELYNLEESCLNASAIKLKRDSDFSVETPDADTISSQNSDESKEIDEKILPATQMIEEMVFPPADYKFELTLLDDYKVLVQIINCPQTIQANVFWFPESNEKILSNNNYQYKCDTYDYPSFETNVLNEDTTYTFCIMPFGKIKVSPFNCLPFYVPRRKLPHDMKVWIPQEYKNLTIFTFCMTLVFALILGSGTTYWTYKTYPHLFQSSKNVILMNKDLDRTLRVSTIEGMKSLRIRKSLPLYANSSRKTSTTTSHCSSSAKNVDRAHSLKLNLMRKRLEICTDCMLDNYEIPRSNCKCSCADDNFASEDSNTSNNIPPPLPQRNSK